MSDTRSVRLHIDSTLAVVYSPRMVAPVQGGFSPSAAKPAQVVADWARAGLPLRVVEPVPATVEELCLAHDRAHVEDTLALRKANGFGTRSADAAATFPHTTGAMLTGARLAMREHTLVCAPCSGFHHAGWRHGGGFCTFNGLMVTTLTLLRTGEARRIGIVDCDHHYGDGTEEILEHIGAPAEIRHFTAGETFGLPADAPAFFERLDEELAALADYDVVLYQAGADPHVNDRLGGWLTTEQLRRRDAVVLGTLARMGVPVVWNLAGGYQWDEDGSIAPVLEIHRNTAIEHLRAGSAG
jgi:acetoin utilization deacetylase AcuC-like enzyme